MSVFCLDIKSVNLAGTSTSFWFFPQGVMTDKDFRFMARTVAGMLLKAGVMRPCQDQDQGGNRGHQQWVTFEFGGSKM